MAEEKSVRLLGRLPLDPRVARSCDEGLNPLTEFPDSPVVNAVNDIVKGESRIYFITCKTVSLS